MRSVNTYSAGAAAVIMPRVLGGFEPLLRRNVSWNTLTKHTDLVVAFGGMAIKNSSVSGGGTSRHVVREAITAARQRGTAFVLVSPLRTDLAEEAAADWVAIRPGTDTAVMLGIAHTLAMKLCTTAPFSTGSVKAIRRLRRICSAALTASRRTLIGPLTSRKYQPTSSGTWHGVWQAGAHWWLPVSRCSARSMASSRSGWQ